MWKKLMENKKLRADIILVASLLAVALSVLLISYFTKEEGGYVIVSVNGEEVARYSLNKDGEYVINGGTNILVIENRQAYLIYSNCPDKTCVFGNSVFGNKISYAGQRIDCLPNRVMIEIIGTEEEVLE